MKSSFLKEGVIFTIILIMCVWALFPFYWMVSTSLKLENEFWSIPPTWIPMEPNLRNYMFFFETIGISRSFFNSFIISTGSVIITIIIGSLAGYHLARFQFRGKRHVAFWILSQKMLPPISLALPIFIMYRAIGLFDTHIGMIFIYTVMNLPFAVWILRSFFVDIPTDMEESAMIDGASRFGAFFRIIFPIAAPGIVATAILCFIFSWNEFLFAYALTKSTARTLPLDIVSLRHAESWRFGLICAVCTIAVVPVAIFTLFVQKYIVRGLTLGGIKG